jgi:hypothetical protein
MARDLPLAALIRLHVRANKEVAIRMFGVSLLAVAALAAARLLWKRRQGELLSYLEVTDGRLEDLRAAGL